MALVVAGGGGGGDTVALVAGETASGGGGGETVELVSGDVAGDSDDMAGEFSGATVRTRVLKKLFKKSVCEREKRKG